MKKAYFGKILPFYLLSILFASPLYADAYQINLDQFDKETMTRILKTHGSFEIVGPSVEALSESAIAALDQAKTVFDLGPEVLSRVYHKSNFHGFQNVQSESYEKFLKDGKTPVRNQFAFHFKPYLADSIPVLPEDIENLKAYSNYYSNSMALLHRLYGKLAEAYHIPIERLTNFKAGPDTSALTSRKYFPDAKGTTGIPPHSDYGLLTLLVSDRDGLEILEGENTKTGKWIHTSCATPYGPRFYINVGDWLLFQIGNKEFVAGVHQVPPVDHDRYSLAVFLNPPHVQKLTTFTGVEVNYGDYLRSDKKAFHINPRLE
jgi:isopenicillin N synthase-like dioxygenase